MKSLISIILITFCLFGQGKSYSIGDIFLNDDFHLNGVYGTQWTPDGNGYVFLYEVEDQFGLKYYDIKTNETTVYLDVSKNILDSLHYEKRFKIKNFHWSPTNTNELLIPRYNDLFLYERSEDRLTQLTFDKNEERDPLYSPDGKKIAYLKNNNLYVLHIESKREEQITFQGTEKILVGKFDWVYEEEFAIRTGFSWSDNSDRLVYFELTDAETDRFPIVDYIPTKNTVEYLPYPKAGEDNSTVRIASVDIKTKESVYSDVSSNKDELIPRVKWSTEKDQYVIYKMTRDQDELELFKTNAVTGKSVKLFDEIYREGWIDINDDQTFLEDGSFIWKSRQSGYYHLYHYDKFGKLVNQLTEGEWEITKVHGFDEKAKMIYFTAAKESPLNRELYSVSIDTKKMTKLSTGIGYRYFNVSTNFGFFLDHFSNTTTLPIVNLYDISGKKVNTIVHNLESNISDYNQGIHEFVQFEARNGEILNARITKPNTFDDSKTYPVMVYQYSGPGSQKVRNAYFARTHLWHSYLTQNDIIVLHVDTRGTGYRGRKFEQQTNHKLMQLEAEDLETTADYLRSLDYIAKDKVGIWGWSYGGQMSSYVHMKYPDAYNLSIAVAPVVNYRNYDTIYSERFMSTPDKNGQNYDEGSTAKYASDLKNPFLLIHGTGDDNVHLSNSMQLVHELVKYQKQFETFFYPRSMHSMLYDEDNTQPHLYTMMTNFIFKHFDIKKNK